MVRAHAINAADPSLILAGGSLLSHVSSLSTANKGVYARKKIFKKEKYVSFNIKGINNAVKRKKLLCWLKKEKANIVLLQETHLDDKEHEVGRCGSVG